jgi:hypothetical protein
MRPEAGARAPQAAKACRPGKTDQRGIETEDRLGGFLDLQGQEQSALNRLVASRRRGN